MAKLYLASDWIYVNVVSWEIAHGLHKIFYEKINLFSEAQFPPVCVRMLCYAQHSGSAINNDRNNRVLS